MRLVNLAKDPYAKSRRGSWNGDAKRNEDGTWTYMLRDGQTNGTCNVSAKADTKVGNVVCVRVDNPAAYSKGIEHCDTVMKGADWIAARLRDDMDTSISLQSGPLTLLALAVYEDDVMFGLVMRAVESGVIAAPFFGGGDAPMNQ